MIANVLIGAIAYGLVALLLAASTFQSIRLFRGREPIMGTVVAILTVALAVAFIGSEFLRWPI